MKKQVGNVDSKYAFEPNKLDEDIKLNKQKLEQKKNVIDEHIEKILTKQPDRMSETFELIIEVLREKKVKYDI